MKTRLIVGLTNAVPVGESIRRILSVPFGEHPHPDEVIQVVNAGTAGKLVARLKALVAAGRRGAPVYNGHPDDGDGAPVDPAIYGWAVDGEVGESAVAFTCDLTPDGMALVRGGKNLFSPHWLARLANAMAYPFELLSIGLTDRPVIPVAAIANQQSSAAGGGKGVPMRDRLMALLKKLGIECPAEASDDALAGLIETAQGKVTTLANELSTSQAQVTNLTGERDTLKGEIETHKGTIAAGVTALANEKKVRQGLLLDQALADGRVTPASRRQWETEFGADFDGTVVKLANARPVAKTRSATDGLPERGAAGTNVTRIVTLVNEEREKSGCDHHTAHLRVKAAHPELFCAK